jgi:hypothetical protein
MKKILFIFILLFSNSVKSEEIINLDLQCDGKVNAFGAVEGQNNFSETISIRNNYFGNKKLNVRQGSIFLEETVGGKLVFSFIINRMNGKFVMIKLSNDSKTIYEINASCSKQDMKKKLF